VRIGRGRRLTKNFFRKFFRRAIISSHFEPSAFIDYKNVATRPSKKKSRKKNSPKAAKVGVRKKTLSALTGEALDGYFNKLNGHKPGDLYQLVIGEVEKPLFKAVLQFTNGNQSEAAEILGINRGTLRKKLRSYNLRP
jgi:Fis family transcriptional regulator